MIGFIKYFFILQFQPLSFSVLCANNIVQHSTRKAASKVEWRYTEEGKRVRVTLPSGAILQPTAFSRVLADGVDPAMYIGKVCFTRLNFYFRLSSTLVRICIYQ